MCAPDEEWSYHPKHVEQFSINKLCNVSSRWNYIKMKDLPQRKLFLATYIFSIPEQAKKEQKLYRAK